MLSQVDESYLKWTQNDSWSSIFGDEDDLNVYEMIIFYNNLLN